MTTRYCYETGRPLPESAPASARFIDAEARQAWNNRRKVRGSQLYDLFMAYRYDRQAAKALGLFSQLCKLAQAWRDEDKMVGRTSFEPLEIPVRLSTRPPAEREEAMAASPH